MTVGAITSSSSLTLNGLGSILNLGGTATLITSSIAGTGITVGDAGKPTINLGNNAMLKVAAITVPSTATLTIHSTSSTSHLLIVTGGLAAITGGMTGGNQNPLGKVNITNNDLILQGSAALGKPADQKPCGTR